MSALRQPWVAAMLLWCAVLASAAGAVYTRHRSRELFVELEKLHRERDQLDIAWGQLQLEQSAWSAHAFVERVATRRLNMGVPDPRPASRWCGLEPRSRAATRAASACAPGSRLACWRWPPVAWWRARSTCSWSIKEFLISQGDARFTREVDDGRQSRRDRRSQWHAAGDQHAGGFGVGQSAASSASCRIAGRSSPRRSSAIAASSRAACPAARIASFIWLARASDAAGCAGRAQARRAGRVFHARAQALLPGRRSGGSCAGFHQRRRRRARRAPSWPSITGWPARVATSACIQDRMGRKVEDIENIRTARPGRDLTLSLDMRIQYLAYRELKTAIARATARVRVRWW